MQSVIQEWECVGVIAVIAGTQQYESVATCMMII